MQICTIYKDEKIHVKSVSLNGKYFYTRTYYFDAEGYVEKMVTVYASGAVDIQ